MRELDGRVDAALRLEPGVRRPAHRAHLVQRHALARGLQRAAVRGRLEHERGAAARRLRLDQPARRRRPELLIPGDEQRHPARPRAGTPCWLALPSSASACSASTSPAFMSKHPGPRSTPSRTWNGCVSSDPSGHTVSWCARTRTPPERPEPCRSPCRSQRRGQSPSRQRRCVRPSVTIRSGSVPRWCRPSAATRSALRATASRTDDGDSHRTSVSMSVRMAGSRSLHRGDERRPPRSPGPVPGEPGVLGSGGLHRAAPGPGLFRHVSSPWAWRARRSAGTARRWPGRRR